MEHSASHQPEAAGVQATPARDQFAAALRGFGPIGILAILIILAGNFLFLPLSALLVLIWAWRSRTPWREIGYARPKNWIVSTGVGLIFGIAFKLLMKSMVMPLLGADPINHAYQYLTGNRSAIASTLFLLIVGAGFGEETLFRGYMFERLGKLFGRNVTAKASIVVLTSVVFGLAHYADQGLTGVEQATIVGLAFATIFAVTGRIWLLMVAHAAFDLTAYALIYWGVETRVANWMFR